MIHFSLHSETSTVALSWEKYGSGAGESNMTSKEPIALVWARFGGSLDGG